jgi:hypothetical protein
MGRKKGRGLRNFPTFGPVGEEGKKRKNKASAALVIWFCSEKSFLFPGSGFVPNPHPQ